MVKNEIQYVHFFTLFEIPLLNGLFRPTSERGSGIKMINMGEIFEHSKIGNIDMQRVNLSPREMSKFLLQPGDLLFARSSLTLEGAGKCSLFQSSSEPVTFESHIIRARLNKHIADPDYYYYFFNSTYGRGTIETIVEQVAAAGIRSSDLSNLIVPLPNLNNQKKISSMLCNFDNKIQNNNKINNLIKKILNKIFIRWFLEFQFPSENNKPYKSIGGEMIDSKIGRIPKGWKVDKLHNVVKISSGKRPPYKSKEPSQKMKIPIYGSGGIMGYIDKSLFEEPILLTGRVGTLGLIFYILDPVWVSDNTLVITKSGNLQEYLYFVLQKINLASLNRGSTQPLLTQTDLGNLNILIPSEPLITNYHKFSRLLFDMINNNVAESKSLIQLRNRITSKLISYTNKVSDS